MSETVDTRCLKTLFDKYRKKGLFYIQTRLRKVHFLSFLPSIYHFKERKDEHWIWKLRFLQQKCSRKLNSKNGWGNWILFNNPKVFDLTQKWIIMNDKSILCWEGEMHSKRLIVKLLLPFRAFALVKTTCWLMNTSTLLICHWDEIEKA